MPRSKKNSSQPVATSQEKAVIRYPTERLLKSKALSGYQPDFARAILTEKEYAIDEAKAAIDKVLKKEVNSNGRRNME